MKVYITKYALTKGILIKESEISSNTDDMIRVNGLEFYHKPEWHLNEKDAIQQAEKMRSIKISSLEKQLEKIKKLNFTI